MTKTFPKEIMLDILYGDKQYKIIKNELVDTSRWSKIYELVFQEPGQKEDEAWETSYSTGATELQEEYPWEYDKEVECALVRAKEKTVIVWETVNA